MDGGLIKVLVLSNAEQRTEGVFGVARGRHLLSTLSVEECPLDIFVECPDVGADTASRSDISRFFLSAQVIVLFFDVCNRQSFTDVSVYSKTEQTLRDDEYHRCTVVLGYCADPKCRGSEKYAGRQVGYEEAKTWARSQNYAYYEIVEGESFVDPSSPFVEEVWALAAGMHGAELRTSLGQGKKPSCLIS